MALDPTDLSRLSAAYPSLSGLPPSLGAAFAADARVIDLPAGLVVFQPGQSCPGLPLLLEGQIKVSQTSSNGRQLVLYRVRPGETCVVSTGCLLESSTYSALGEVERPTRAVALPPLLFRRLLDEHAPFRALVFGQFSRRLQTLMAVVDDVAFHRLDERMAGWLSERAPRVVMTHQAIADEFGSAREVVTRVLRQFVEEGLVDVSRDGIVVLNAAGLRRRAQPPSG
ncbi:Crp/Fnr family transcriptional regulator [Silanimonas sp.]|uniref:Crp/Fnr family transcriptional regulator n=1 Tax=Silanimonas sp. TaxID=1929290 RepID=UPI0022C3C906|nr:Crp/Fnr family transcriptional regulator [Silanimonas sp.]MCZ8114182.1 Crp/Fnr family transcriptional regulator [Silanimonas sp.]